jgi:cytochrome c
MQAISEIPDFTDSAKFDYIRPIVGKDTLLDEKLNKKGKVLISSGHCNTCYTDERKAKGPAFQDIARRYQSNQPYIDLLAQKVITGGKDSWGNPVMSPHPNLEYSDAEAMVTYIFLPDN